MTQLPDWAERLWEPSRYKVMRGGRGSAKSRTTASALLIQAVQGVHRVLCAREIQKSIKDSVKRLLDDEIERLGLSDFFESTENEIRGCNGSLFIFAGLRERIALARVPQAFVGAPIAFITISLLALAFMGFSGLNV